MATCIPTSWRIMPRNWALVRGRAVMSNSNPTPAESGTPVGSTPPAIKSKSSAAQGGSAASRWLTIIAITGAVIVLVLLIILIVGIIVKSGS